MKDPNFLTIHVRSKLAETISAQYRDENGKLHAITFDPVLQDQICADIRYTDHGMYSDMSPSFIDKLCRDIRSEIEKLTSQGRTPIVVVDSRIRLTVKRITSCSIPELVVLGTGDITSDTRLIGHGVVMA